jgi:hypothetical protein
MKKLRDLDSRENRNILKLEIDKIMTEGIKILKRDRQFLTLKALNSPSPRPSSFTVSVEKERFTDPFFRLLDSPGKNAEMF